jgi:hypothetical protein
LRAELEINKYRHDDGEEDADKEAETEIVIAVSRGLLATGAAAKISVAMLAARCFGVDRLKAKGTLDQFFDYRHADNY